MSSISDFKSGIFGLRTNFGELAELMIAEYFNLYPSESKYYDLTDQDGVRFEIKFSRAFEKKKKMTRDNAIELCLDGNALHNVVNSYEATVKQYDCNIQQIKPDEFDTLIYGVFFNDVIEIFQVDSDKISNMPASSNRQHKGNVGEGQFHIKRNNIEEHRRYYRTNILTYDELFNLLSI